MSQQVYCEKCLEVIDKYEDLVIVNEKPYHYLCYEKELKEEKKKTIVQRFMTWRFINSGLIANIQALMMIILGGGLYLFAENFKDPGLYKILGTLIIICSILVRIYGLLSYEIKVKRAVRRSRVLESKDSVLQVFKIEAIDLLKLGGFIAIIGAIWYIIAAVVI